MIYEFGGGGGGDTVSSYTLSLLGKLCLEVSFEVAIMCYF